MAHSAVAAVALAFGTVASLLRPVWLDELFSLRLARMPILGIFDALGVDSGPPGHYLLLHAIFRVFPWPEGDTSGILAARLPSVLAATATLLLLLRAERRFSPGRAPFGTVLLSLWLPFWYFASEARPYALLSAGVAALFLEGPGWIRKGGLSTWAFASVAGALPLLHNTGILYAAAALPIVLAAPDRRQRIRAATAFAVALLPFAAFLPVLAGQPRESIAWMNLVVPGRETLGVLSPAGPFPALFEPPPAIAPAVVSAVALALLASAVAIGIFRPGEDRRPSHLFLLGLLPLGAILASPLSGTSAYFPGRSEAAAMPLVALAAGTALRRVSRGVLVAALPHALLAAATLGSWPRAIGSAPERAGVRAAAELAPVVGDGDLVVVAGLHELEMRWGFARASRGAPGSTPWIVAYPPALSRHPGWIAPADLDPRRLTISAAATVRLAEAARVRRVVLAGSPSLLRPLRTAFSGWRQLPLHEEPAFAVVALMR